jgi:hypothetical protein
MQLVTNFIWISAINVTARSVYIHAGFLAHNLRRAVDQ